MIDKIINNENWYIAEIVERAENVGSDKSNPNRRCTVWVNAVLVKAKSPEQAYEKAVSIGKEKYGPSRYKAAAGNTVQWRFLGIKDIIPIYENIEHGSEIFWEKWDPISVKKSERMIKSKKDLIRGAQRP
ncbi:DUF4288 domain-containing protein [Candidatus Sumerlaeota bacterium]|nr:DUF4288 domain-containing protein [Candidatus Sumerlaeota bacterium]